MLIQALCEKVWILDNGVVGTDLAATFAELLTVDARLALAEDASLTNQPTDREGVRVYHRRARSLRGLLRDLDESSPRLVVERPYGPLPLEHQNPASPGRQGSDVLHLADLIGLEPALGSGPIWQRRDECR